MHRSFVYIKKICFKFLHTILVLMIMYNISYAGSIIEVDGVTMYSNDTGQIAKDTWVWIDTNKDSIAECYRFDKDGHLALNYTDKYGKRTNDKGQFTENGEVIKKMLSNGKILNKKDTPKKGIFEFVGNTANLKTKTKTDKWTKKKVEVVEYETNGISETIDGQILYASYTDKGIDILNAETLESGIIYADGKASEISDGVYDNREIIVGKDFRRFITSKNKCSEKIKEAYIYGGNKWKEVLVLKGNGASVKFKLDNVNFMRFEVAHQTHGEETRDTDMTLDIFVDNVLVDSCDEFVDDMPQIVEEYLEGVTNVELKLNIKAGAIGRKVYIRNGRFKKVKIKD